MRCPKCLNKLYHIRDTWEQKDRRTPFPIVCKKCKAEIEVDVVAVPRFYVTLMTKRTE